METSEARFYLVKDCQKLTVDSFKEELTLNPIKIEYLKSIRF